jgi:hypothetical protein
MSSAAAITATFQASPTITTAKGQEISRRQARRQH